MSNAPGLPLRPWWHHPGHRYEGKHRGTYPYAARYKDMLIPLGVIRLGEYVTTQT